MPPVACAGHRGHFCHPEPAPYPWPGGTGGAPFAPGVAIVAADLARTVFCDSSGIRQPVLAYHCAAATMPGDC